MEPGSLRHLSPVSLLRYDLRLRKDAPTRTWAAFSVAALTVSWDAVSLDVVIAGSEHGHVKVFQPAAGYPPPSRTEFVGAAVASQCLGGREGPARCPALTKCVAAMPASASASAAAAAANYR